jgi:hypothetical protein
VRFDRTVIHEMRMPYAVGLIGAGPGASVACGTEDHGPMVRIDPPYREAYPLVSGPGGCMGVAMDPVRPSDLYAIMGCFPGYRFQGGGIYRIRAGAEPERVLDLPFAHRIGFGARGGRRVLLAASLAADKDDAADWSQPGTVYAAELGEEPVRLRLEPVLTGVHKNHGFLLAQLEGRSSLLIGGQEGLMAIDLEASGARWPVRQILAGETSEMALLDVDGDGETELLTIEPFHGNALRAYRRTPSAWALFWEAELEFGHGLTAGAFLGARSVLVSSRAGAKELVLFQFEATAPARPHRFVLETGAGAANMAVVSHAGREHVLSANQATGQIVRYTPRD